MTITINGSGTITGASTLATAVASPAFTTPTIDSAQIPTVSGTAPLYMCRAWVNFNGTGTVAIRGSGNVTSITDNGTGDYTVNFTTAMPDANYSTNVTSGPNNASVGGILGEAACYSVILTSSIRIAFIVHTGSIVDTPYGFVAIFR